MYVCMYVCGVCVCVCVSVSVGVCKYIHIRVHSIIRKHNLHTHKHSKDLYRKST